MLGQRPIDAGAGVDHLAAALQQALHGLVQGEVVGNRGDAAADFAQPVGIDAGIAAPRRVLGLVGRHLRPAAVEPVGLVRAIAVRVLQFRVELLAVGRFHLVDFRRRDALLGDEFLRIEADDALVLADGVIHHRLRERRLVALVVAVPAIAEHVDDDGLLEALAELGGDLGAMHDGFGIVAVDVEDRRLDHLGDVGGVGRRARVARRRREADLVVDDEVQRAAGAVAAQARQAEAFGDDALAGKGRVAVDQDRQHARAVLVLALILLGARLAEHDGIDDFEMRGVGRQRQVHLVAVELAVRRGAEVVFHVAGTVDVVGLVGAALEFVEDGAQRLRHDAGEHVQAAAMGHAEDDFLHAELAAALDDLLERGDRRTRCRRGQSAWCRCT